MFSIQICARHGRSSAQIPNKRTAIVFERRDRKSSCISSLMRHFPSFFLASIITRLSDDGWGEEMKLQQEWKGIDFLTSMKPFKDPKPVTDRSRSSENTNRKFSSST